MAEMLDGTMDLPGAGKVKRKYIIIPAALAAAYVGWRWWSASRDTGPSTSDGLYSTPDLTDMGQSTTGSGGSVSVGGNNGNQWTDGTNPNAINDNAAWTGKAADQLEAAGWNRQAVLSALGNFLARRSLDKTEAQIVRAALASTGQPPVGGPYSVIEAAATGNATLKAPTGLKVSAADATSVTLAWSAVAGAAGYDVARSGANAVRSSGTSVRITGLASNTSYSFTVAAVAADGKAGPKSAAVSGKTKPVTLTRPTGLKASAITKTSFRVTANKVPGATYYRWWIDGKQVAPSDQPYRDFTGLKAGTSHKVTVAGDTTTQSPGPQSAALTVKTKK
ncbi:fibronectin type III domain-containing protein [Streptomyces sp. NPDC087787]|uniref:fibronectin type III domain-containing protein n=1 Tax=Streptomyces sp. NPDC087787 TaxID=3365803 RepID=UPI00380C4E37